MFEILKFAHILSMFTAVAAFVGGEMYLQHVSGSRDVRAIRRVYEAGKRNDGIGIAGFLAGIVFGILTALNGDLSLTDGWLLTAYGFVVAILAMGIGYWTPRAKKILAAAEASPDDGPSVELIALLTRPVDRVLLAFDLLLWAGVIFVMVVKPFS